jgi:UPF0176 protein
MHTEHTKNSADFLFSNKTQSEMNSIELQSADAHSELSKHFYISTVYCFTAIGNLESAKARLKFFASQNSVRGLVILAPEGLNSTFSAPTASDREYFKNFLREFLNTTDIMFKDSEADVCPFRRFSVKLRDEIVTLNTPDLVPMDKSFHLSPQQWNEVLKNETGFVMIDTRNWYETKIGTFKNSLVPPIDQFTQFPEFVESQNIPKDEKMLIFCTGGVRCEKGILDLQKRGYKNVFQLDGGILNYLNQYPNDQFEGECFVFDNRVALDQNLKASQKYSLCPHCGQPAQVSVDCKRCDTDARICDDCLKLDVKKDTCSKHCAHWYQMDPTKKGKHQDRSWV